MSLGTIIIAVVVFLFLVVFGPKLIERVDSGEIHVLQSPVAGTMTVHSQPGMYFQKFGKVTKYVMTDSIYLSNDEDDGGKGSTTMATTLRFGDGGTAEVGSVTQWRMPLTEDEVLKIHKNFRSFGALKAQVRQWIIEVEKQTASTFKAEETYSTRRGEFSQVISDQLSVGLYATKVVTVDEATGDVDDDGEPLMTKTLKTEIQKDTITKVGVFGEYGVILVNHTLKDIAFDETIDRLISQKKQAEQARAVARSNAEKARQDAITAEEEGKANVAIARAREEVAKITAVTQAEKQAAVARIEAEQKKLVAETNAQRDLNVAELATKEAREAATQRLVKEKAEADANALKVRAGLTPQQAAEWDFKIADVVSKNLASVDLPDMMIFGGGGEGSPMNPWDAVGLESFMKISDTISNK